MKVLNPIYGSGRSSRYAHAKEALTTFHTSSWQSPNHAVHAQAIHTRSKIPAPPRGPNGDTLESYTEFWICSLPNLQKTERVLRIIDALAVCVNTQLTRSQALPKSQGSGPQLIKKNGDAQQPRYLLLSPPYFKAQL